VYMSDPYEVGGEKIQRVSMPPHGIVTLRIE
jgi:hypothetical protein